MVCPHDQPIWLSFKLSRPSVKLTQCAKGFAANRQRLGLSQKDYGALIGASALSVYKWEQGEVRPRQRYLSAIAQIRTLGKKEAAHRLAREAA